MSADRPVDNAPYLTHTHGGLTIEGWSRAAVQSYWRIPELKVGFDLGAQPWDFMGTGTWFVSHTHLDHIAALPVYVARRRMMKMEPPTIYVPVEMVDDVKKLMLIFQRLDRGRQLAEIRGVAFGDEIEPGDTSAREDRQGRAHAPGRFPGARRSIPERVDRGGSLQHSLPSERSPPAARSPPAGAVEKPDETVDLTGSWRYTGVYRI